MLLHVYIHTALGYSRSPKEDLIAKGVIKKVVVNAPV